MRRVVIACLFIGACAVAILLWTHGELGLLVVFYSINVFLCLMLSKLGLWRYWWNRRCELRLGHLLVRLSIAVAGLTVAVLVLVVTLKEKFFDAGKWRSLASGPAEPISQPPMPPWVTQRPDRVFGAADRPNRNAAAQQRSQRPRGGCSKSSPNHRYSTRHLSHQAHLGCRPTVA